MIDRRKLYVAIMIFKILNNEAPNCLSNLIDINKCNTRSKNKLIIKKANDNLHKTSFSISGPRLWNTLPDEIQNCKTIKCFKEKMKMCLLDKQ